MICEICFNEISGEERIMWNQKCKKCFVNYESYFIEQLQVGRNLRELSILAKEYAKIK